ncbi:hypothetical protein [Flavobacterium noncentrifugens]|uniref:Uncharacterized protein n=1 Tax=Flavobacterium noncentrifugens TaxID=1128970 RepID=A0A1G8REE0_9FLAO|nr:hypothetical protein [Flavobacterium noncentrifugens]SDJ15279.1 hypothetical protein SAMN04487935_0082 [Flavobacterium noncentrifugens]
MIVLLIAMIVSLVSVIVFLNVRFYREKKVFKTRIEVLQQIIFEISEKQNGQRIQLRLSDEIDHKLKSAKATLSDDIFGLNYELFEILSKNNRRKK